MNSFMLILMLVTASPDVHKEQVIVSNIPSMEACRDLQKMFPVGLVVEDSKQRDAKVQSSSCVISKAT